MTQDTFRRLALELPETSEAAHMGHPDFRVGGKIFATLWPGSEWGMVKVRPDQQDLLVLAEPSAFEPVKGAWGRRGCTKVRLKTVKTSTLRRALAAAWQNTAPKHLAQKLKETSAVRPKS